MRHDPPGKAEGQAFRLTAEVTPPVSVDRDDLLAKALPLKGLADAVNITDGAGARPHLGALTAAALLVEDGIEPILQFTCRDRNRIALQSDLHCCCGFGRAQSADAAWRRPERRRSARGQAGVRSRSAPAARNRAPLARHGELPSGRKVSGRADFFLGGADNPIDPAPGWEPKVAAAKLEAGAQFVQTQFCMDAALCVAIWRGWPTRHFGQIFLIGVAPLRSAKSARWMKEKFFGTIIPDAMVARMEKAGDSAAEGRAICVELVAELADIPHVAGCHIMASNNDAVVPEVIRDARERVKRLAASKINARTAVNKSRT